MQERRTQKKISSGKPKTQLTINKQQSKCSLFLGDTELGVKVLAFFDSVGFSIWITLITIVTLYSDDIRQAFFPRSSDVPFSILTLICMTFYVVEMIALCFLKEGYFLKFYFWLDLISTLTMVLDLFWITELLSGGDGIKAAANVAKIARASRASKIGAKSTKLIRILRLIRVLRLYKTASNRLNKENQQKLAGLESKQAKKEVDELFRKQSQKLSNLKNPYSKDVIKDRLGSKKIRQVSLKNIVFEGSNRRLSVLHPSHKGTLDANQAQIIGSDKNNEKKSSDNKIEQGEQAGTEEIRSHRDEPEVDVPVETKVGSKLKDEIQKNIISMILLILISIPLISGKAWLNDVTSYQKAGEEIGFMVSQGKYEDYIKTFISQGLQLSQNLVFFNVEVNSTCCQFPRDYPQYDVPDLDDLRNDEVDIYVSSGGNTFIYDKSSGNILSAELNIGRTTFVCVLLVVATLLFSRDVEEHALEPLENMIDTVKRISANPLQAIRDIEKQNMIKRAIVNENNGEKYVEDTRNQTEPVILQNLIIKIGSLLAVGFGEAGTQLIARNIENHGSLNVMMPGKKSICIFGFCDIRNFTDATEILEANVMVFVNEIASICHEVVNRVGGNPNKNIGDAFLLVWKFGEEDYVTVQNRHQAMIQLRSSLRVRQTADLAVYSFVKMVAELARAPSLQKYKHNVGLKERIKNYQGVKLGYGLHVGWAIEGPIGSEFKIDASYLGSHVNMASRLEAGTKAYGIPILISGDLYNLMTLRNKEHLRQIDRVDAMAGEKPMDLYTVDISQDNLLKIYGLEEKKELNSFEKKKARVFHNQQRDKLMDLVEKKRVTGTLWNDDRDIAAMREPFTKFFFEEWKRGFEEFQKGNWTEASVAFKKTLILGLNHNDGPSENLLKYMKERNMTPPDNWNGVREFYG